MMPALFVVGCGRSGTTLLRAMLDSHSQIAVPPESHFVPGLLRRWPSGAIGRDEFVSQLVEEPRFLKWGLTEADLSLVVSGSPTTVEAIDRLFRCYGAARSKPLVADKTPPYIKEIPLLSTRFPAAQFVHLVRDGRDVGLSYLDVPFGPKTIEAAASHWRSRVMGGHLAGLALGDRYHVVRYEDLIDDPERELTRVLAPLALEYEDGMLNYASSAEDLRSGTLVPEAHRGLDLPPTSGLRDWEATMDDRSQAAFQHLAGDALELFGYRPTGVPRIRPGLFSLARIRLAKLRG